MIEIAIHRVPVDEFERISSAAPAVIGWPVIWCPEKGYWPNPHHAAMIEIRGGDRVLVLV